MWWIIVIVGAVCFAILLLYAWIGNERRKGVGQELILERIAREYLARRQNGETIDQIADVLYKHYGISKPVEFWFGYYKPAPVRQPEPGWRHKAVARRRATLG